MFILTLKKYMARLSQTFSQRGFSLIEFIVILTIFSIMASVALFNFRGFRNTISLSNLANDVALTIRQAQVFGISASESLELRGLNVGSDTRGVYFEKSSGSGAGDAFESRFVVFSDFPVAGGSGNGLFDVGEPVIDEISISSDDKIIRIEGETIAGAGSGLLQPIRSDLHITFTRPDPDATIRTASQFYHRIVITLESADGRQKTVQVVDNGQIGVGI